MVVSFVWQCSPCAKSLTGNVCVSPCARYGFHKEAPGGTDAPGGRKARLLEIFGHWNDNVVDLIKATPEEDVLRRDIYDR